MIYRMIEPLPYDETNADDATVIDNTKGNICCLALLLGEKAADKVGRSFNLATRFNIEGGAIYLAYRLA